MGFKIKNQLSCLSTKLYPVGTQKNHLHEKGDGSLGLTKNRFKLMDKKIITILRSTFIICLSETLV